MVWGMCVVFLKILKDILKMGTQNLAESLGGRIPSRTGDLKPGRKKAAAGRTMMGVFQNTRARAHFARPTFPATSDLPYTVPW